MLLGFFKSKPILSHIKVVTIWQPASKMSVKGSKLLLKKLLESQGQASLLGGNLSRQSHQLQKSAQASLFRSGPLREGVINICSF